MTPGYPQLAHEYPLYLLLSRSIMFLIPPPYQDEEQFTRLPNTKSPSEQVFSWIIPTQESNATNPQEQKNSTGKSTQRILWEKQPELFNKIKAAKEKKSKLPIKQWKAIAREFGYDYHLLRASYYNRVSYEKNHLQTQKIFTDHLKASNKP
jgi:hypothetical protein